MHIRIKLKCIYKNVKKFRVKIPVRKLCNILPETIYTYSLNIWIRPFRSISFIMLVQCTIVMLSTFGTVIHITSEVAVY